jgi:hypothetical protein
MKQSILPVVAWVKNKKFIRCTGTAFVISCSGYVMTACHVLLDLKERDYGKVVREGSLLTFMDNLSVGVFIPLSPAYGRRALAYLPFEYSYYWGKWKSSPLIHKQEELDMLTDVAICKIPEMPNGGPHQPLSLSLNRFAKGEKAYAFGYAEMDDIPVEIKDGRPVFDFECDISASISDVVAVFPENHLKKDVPPRGPCFDFRAKIPGKMSGGPILGDHGSVVRGVVSRSFSKEKHAYGAMPGPAMRLPLIEGETLKDMMESGNEGIAQVHGQGL